MTGAATWDIWSNTMPPRPAWNYLGPALPRWFIERLAEIEDGTFVMQFLPPRRAVAKFGGDSRIAVDDRQYPHGVWVICQRYKRTRWLYCRWVFALVTDDAHTALPKPALLRFLRHAIHDSRHNRGQQMLDLWESQARAISESDAAVSKEAQMERMDAEIRKRGFGARLRPRVFFPAACGEPPAAGSGSPAGD